MKRLLDITDFSREGLREALNLMTFIKENRNAYSAEMDKKTLVTAFFADDRNSEAAFSTAAVKMGGSVIPFKPGQGESLKDAVMAMSAYADVIALSHPKKGAARAASLYARVPVINAGDGGRAFPVKTLSDFSSVWIEKKHVSNMNIGFLGDFSSIISKESLKILIAFIEINIDTKTDKIGSITVIFVIDMITEPIKTIIQPNTSASIWRFIAFSLWE